MFYGPCRTTLQLAVAHWTKNSVLTPSFLMCVMTTLRSTNTFSWPIFLTHMSCHAHVQCQKNIRHNVVNSKPSRVYWTIKVVMSLAPFSGAFCTCRISNPFAFLPLFRIVVDVRTMPSEQPAHARCY